jgi:hypothetical protein
VTASPFPRLRAVIDVQPASWVEDGVGEFGSGVNALLPAVFEAYARILHPAGSRFGGSVRWEAVAEWAGRLVHPRVQFTAIEEPVPGAGIGPQPWDQPPRAGVFPAGSLPALCEVLAAHTGTPQSCWFALWEGWGWIGQQPGGLAAIRDTPDQSGPPPVTRSAPSLAAEQLNGPRVRLPGRDYLLFEGPLDAVGEIGHRGEDYFFPQSPNLFWPDDRGWCVATEVDLDSTYVGGSTALVADLIADPRLEVVPASPRDPIDITSDHLNR